jgi:hypothetical protein
MEHGCFAAKKTALTISRVYNQHIPSDVPDDIPTNVGKTTINHPFGNGFYQL